MTRSLKTFLKLKKGYCERQECGCLLISMRRDYENHPEYCGCEENKTSLSNYVRIDGQIIYFFNENEEQNNEARFEMDTELGIRKFVVGEFLIIKDEDARALWLRTWDYMEAETVMKLFGWEEGKEGVGHFTPEAMAQFNALINNPTEEQAQILRGWLENKAADESPIVVFDLPNYVKVEGDTIDGGGIQLFNDEPGNSLSVEIDTDTEEGGYRIVVGPFLIIEDENARFLWQNMWESLDAEQVIKLFGMDEGKGGTGRFVPEAMARFNTLIDNPIEDYAEGLKEWLEGRASNGQRIVVFDE